MDYSYVASGRLFIFGCAEPNNATYTVETLFEVNDFAWIKKQANKGILERINIKKINFINIIAYNYQDTFNRLWVESELTDLATAQDLVNSYLMKQELTYQLHLRLCSSTIN